jgi:PhnB protein
MSRIQTNPFVNFGGRAREAMNRYQEVLGGTLHLWTLNERGEAQPAEAGDRINHARLEADGAVIVGSDGHPDYPATAGNNLAIALQGTDAARVRAIFDGLAAGGRVQLPLTAQPGGIHVGWLVDRFGIHWTVTIDRA